MVEQMKIPSISEQKLMNLDLTFKDRKFSGEDPILIFDFLDRLVGEVGTLEISEGKVMVLLLHSIARSTGVQYHAIKYGSFSGNVGGVVHWP